MKMLASFAVCLIPRLAVIGLPLRGNEYDEQLSLKRNAHRYVTTGASCGCCDQFLGTKVRCAILLTS